MLMFGVHIELLLRSVLCISLPSLMIFQDQYGFICLTRSLKFVAFNQFGLSVKSVRIDNGTEFTCLGPFFQQEGILHQTSCVATPQQNGRVERKHRHILNVARSLLFQESLPTKFWGEAILTAGHLINLTPTSVLKGLTPHEVLFGKKPSYEHIRVFGSACYTHLRSRDKDKFSPRSRNCVFLGYPFGKKGWKVFDLETEEILVSRDVIFREDIFPFAMQVPGTDSVAITSFADDDWCLSPTTLDRGSSVVIIDTNTPAQADVPTQTDTTTHDNSPAQTESVTVPTEEQYVHTETVHQDHADDADQDTVGTLAIPGSDTAPDDASGSIPLGRGHRTKQAPKSLADYLLYNIRCTDNTLTDPVLSDSIHASSPVSGSTPYLLEHYISDDVFSTGHQAFLAAILSGVEPKSFKEAMQDKIWRDALGDEIDAFEQNKTFSIVDLPEGKEALDNH